MDFLKYVIADKVYLVKVITKGWGDQKSQKIDNVFCERPLFLMNYFGARSKTQWHQRKVIIKKSINFGQEKITSDLPW